MFSVVIPAYNCEATIDRVLNSVCRQTRADLIEEIVIINDGSTDNTDCVIKEFIRSHPTIRFLYEVQSNHGPSYTRNKAIKKASGEWIALLDADDIWLENKIEVQANVLNENKQIVFLGAAYPVKFVFKRFTKGLHKLSAYQLCLRYMPPTPSVVFKRDVGIKLGLFDESMQYTEDINFFQKFLLEDSYYVLAEKLIKIDVNKRFAAQSGLSSNLDAMARGREHNTRELYRMGLISKPFMMSMLVMSRVKYLRRLLQHHVSSAFYMIGEKRHENSDVPTSKLERTYEDFHV